MIDFSNVWLQVCKENKVLPVGEVVYCFVDEGFQFRVKTSRQFHGVYEFIFEEESKNKFAILN